MLLGVAMTIGADDRCACNGGNKPNRDELTTQIDGDADKSCCNTCNTCNLCNKPGKNRCKNMYKYKFELVNMGCIAKYTNSKCKIVCLKPEDIYTNIEVVADPANLNGLSNQVNKYIGFVNFFKDLLELI